MKQILKILGLTLICFNLSIQKAEPEIILNKYIVNVSALVLREKPDVKSTNLAILFKGKELHLLEDTVKEETINGIKGFWLKVKTNQNKIGYVFGAYVSKIQIIDNDKIPHQTDPFEKQFCAKVYPNGCECAQAIEKALLKSDSAVLRKNKSLIIKAENGKENVYTDKDDETTDSYGHALRGYFKDINYYVILTCYYEAGKFILINKKNGISFEILGFPHSISPSKKNILILVNDEGFSGIQILNIESGKPTIGIEFNTELSINNYKWQPHDATWIGNDQIEIDVHSAIDHEYNYYIHKVRVSKENNKWIVED
jgi:hypothetical protein